MLFMVKIRLTQTGTTNRKRYRVIAIEEHERREGKPIEVLGYYDPTVKPAKVVLERDRIDYWIGQGAVPTESVLELLKRA